MELGSSRARGYWGKVASTVAEAWLRVRLLRGGFRGPAAPPSLGGKVEGQGMRIFVGRVSRK
jgi:hypothetical protein